MYYFLLLCLFKPDIDRLAHPDPATRNQAEARLLRHGDLVWPLLERPSTDAEQRRRLKRLREQIWGTGNPPLALLQKPTRLEWYRADSEAKCISADRPGPDFMLIEQRIDLSRYQYYNGQVEDRSRSKQVVSYLAYLYCCRGRAGRSYPAPFWFYTEESCAATTLLIADLRRTGAPPVVVRSLLRHLHDRHEQVLTLKK